MQASAKTKKTKHKKTFTIGLCGHDLLFDIPISFFRAVQETAIEHDMNMMYIAGEAWHTPSPVRVQSNILYDLVCEQNIDGLIIASNLVGSFVSHTELVDFFRKYDNLPIISLGAIVQGYPSVVLDNAQGMYSAVDHLITEHGYSKIAFICGTSGHSDAEERYQAYVNAMEDNSITSDKKLVLPGDFRIVSGQTAVSIMIDDRGLRPGEDIHALVAANDFMAVGAILELQSRGLHIPEDIAVVGFDNIISGKYTIPSLSTVNQSFDEMGKQAAKLLISLIKGRSVPEITTLPAKYIRRRSCGCTEETIFNENNIAALIKNSLKRVKNNPQEFLQHLATKQYTAGLSEKDLTTWAPSLSMLCQLEKWQWGVPDKEESGEFAKYVWSVLGNAVYNVFQNYEDTNMMINIRDVLSSTLDIKELINVLVSWLKKMGIRKCYLSLYENPPKSVYPHKLPEKSRLIMAYDENGEKKIPEQGILFSSKELIPEDVTNEQARYRLVLMPLYFQEEQIGYWLLDAILKDEKVYSTLTEQLASSLQSVLSLKKYQEQTRELAAANEKIRFLNTQLQDENLKIKTEMDVARKIQFALSPKEIKTIHPDFEISALMVPATEVGGDYYDVIMDMNDNLWLGIGDVAGHGLTSGLIMMMAQVIHSTITSNYKASSRDIVLKANRVLFKNISRRLGENLFMTFTALKYLGKGRFQHAGCHLVLLAYRQRTKTIEKIETHGTWLNMMPDIRSFIKNKEFSLEIGDILILFTDGIIEVFNNRRKMLSIDGFMDIISRNVERNTEKDIDMMRDTVFREVNAWCDGEPADDMTLVLARRIH